MGLEAGSDSQAPPTRGPGNQLHTVHCTLHTVHCTLHTAHCTLHTAHCTLHNAQFTMHTAHCTLTLRAVQCAQCSAVQCSAVQCAQCALCTVHCALCTVHCTLQTAPPAGTAGRLWRPADRKEDLGSGWPKGDLLLQHRHH